MVTPELRFDQDGFLDLSVFPDTEPDVYGHSPAVLDPLLAEDRRELDAAGDDTWLVDAVARLGAGPAADAPDERLASLVPTPTAPADPAPEPPGGSLVPGAGADDDGEDIEVASLLQRFSGREGSAGEGPAT